LLVLSLSPCVAHAAPGDLDPTFGGTGKVITPFDGFALGLSVAVQADGNLVVAGYAFNGSDYDFALVRYNTDGSLDTSFNGTGKVTPAIGSGNDVGHCVAVQSDGKIVAAGTASGNFALVRYNANGSLDTTFNGTGITTTDFGGADGAHGVKFQNDGKIVAAGQAFSNGDFALARYNTDGSVDTSFGSAGKVTTDFDGGGDVGFGMALQSDGKIVVAGYATIAGTAEFAVARYEAGAPTGRLTALRPAKVWVGLKNSDDVGTKFDLLVEVFRNGQPVGSGQLNGVPGGSSGFNNAVARTINLALSAPVDVSPGDALTVRPSVRIAVGEAGHRSGTARLWFNDAAADSHFDATIDGVTRSYYLRSGFSLSITTGPGPKNTVDVFVDRAVGGNPFKPFGTWSLTL